MSALNGLMMDYQLTLTPLMKRANTLFPNKEIITRIGDGYHRYTYADFYKGCCRLANALTKLGVQSGDRIGTFAWNSYRHHELYFAVPCMGAVVHTLNLRLPADQLTYIVNHAEDKLIFVDHTLIKLLEPIADQLTTVEHFVVMGDMPETTLPNVISYDELTADVADSYEWAEIDENSAAAMCYTSGTTGNPKGALYSHRALYLHTMACCLTDTMRLSERDRVMPVVPMFHAMAWGLVYAATMIGADVVYPGAYMTPVDLAKTISDNAVTFPAGVPTLWLGLLQELEKNPELDVSSVRAMPVGGSAAPRSMIEAYQRKYDIEIIHAWGMTELAPIGTVSVLKSHMDDWDDSKQMDYRQKQGWTVPTVEMRIVGPVGEELPWDGETIGELQVRGPHVVSEYYKDERSADSFMDGWFRTGDVCTIDSEGFMQIVDRTKDLVKSGGEWISTVDLENTIMAHHDVLEAAVIAIPHPRWQERPLACVVKRAGIDSATLEREIIDLLSQHFAKWQLPNSIEFIDEVPKTSVGKFDKKVLRKDFADYQFADVEGGD
ncbi:MAG: long-chain fatty acid--CoA ligase [Phototrophicaceae bacterium]